MKKNLFVGVKGNNVCLLRSIATFDVLDKNKDFLDDRDFSDVDMSHWGNGLDVGATLAACGLKETGRTIDLGLLPLMFRDNTPNSEPAVFCVSEIREVVPVLITAPLDSGRSEVHCKYVIRALKTHDSFWNKLKTNEQCYGYAAYDDFSGSFSSGAPCFAWDMTHAICFDTPEAARDWFDQNAREISAICNGMCDKNGVTIAKVETIITDVFSFAHADDQ